jgi:UDP-N-acetylmuramate dehydrogenase
MKNLVKELPPIKGNYRINVSLADTSWFRVGGKAEVLFKPLDLGDLSYFLQNKGRHIDIHILGLASNVIIRDKGIKGVVIRLGRNFTGIDIDKDIVTVGCAVTDYNLASFLGENNLSGLEFLIGIPGSIGGAIAINAGCYGSEISDHLIDVEAVSKSTGKIHKFTNKELGLKYRHNDLANDFIFTKARFKLKYNNNSDTIKETMKQISEMRQLSQPIRERTGGSTFKNPPDKKAWELIDRAGFRNYKYGNAQISDKHCNFLINTGGATASELETLGEMVQQKVVDDCGIKLEWEIKRIGIK